MIYVDTNIYLDAILKRKNEYGRDISIPATNLFYRALGCEFKLVSSSHLRTELSRHLPSDKPTLLGMLKHKFVEVACTEEDRKKAKILSPEDDADALHGILAHKAGAECVVTRNVSHFRCVGNLIPAVFPEDV